MLSFDPDQAIALCNHSYVNGPADSFLVIAGASWTGMTGHALLVNKER